MQLKSILTYTPAFQHLINALPLQSSIGKQYLMHRKMMLNASEIQNELDLQDKLLSYSKEETKAKAFSQIQVKLMHIRDIQGTIRNLAAELVLDDIELFELKGFALLSQDISNILKENEMNLVHFHDLEEVISILDPQRTRIPSFYIYDDYSEELSKVRKLIKHAKAKLAEANTEDNSKALNDLYQKADELETTIRFNLCEQLKNYSSALAENIIQIAHLDLLVAQLELNQNYQLCKPEIQEKGTQLTGMFNPRVADKLKEEKRKFQPIDLELEQSICFITGANMAGKTVILKTLALCQYMLQFGFYIPAKSAKISLVDAILMSIGDEQSEESGLSSFASEMMKINSMVQAAKENQNVLILIDELARTTNPTEGRAIVNAVADIFYKNEAKALITTHYSGLNTHCRKLRVKGLDKEFISGSLSKENINLYMDYSLIEDSEGKVPHEALRIADMLGVDKEIIENAQQHLKD